MRQRDAGESGRRLLEKPAPIQKPPADMRRGLWVALVMLRHRSLHFG
jgi:hypothetical protein